MVRGTHRDASILGNIVTAILICLAIGCRAKSEPSTSSVESLASAVEELKQEAKQQTAVLHRALGKQIPVEMPTELQAELQSLQEAVASNAAGPPSGETAKELQRRVVELLHRIPPWAEEDVLPRLNAIRWAAQLLVTVPVADSFHSNGRCARNIGPSIVRR